MGEVIPLPLTLAIILRRRWPPPGRFVRTLTELKDDGKLFPVWLAQEDDRIGGIDTMVLITLERILEEGGLLHFEGSRTCHEGTFRVRGWCNPETRKGEATFTPTKT